MEKMFNQLVKQMKELTEQPAQFVALHGGRN